MKPVHRRLVTVACALVSFLAVAGSTSGCTEEGCTEAGCGFAVGLELEVRDAQGQAVTEYAGRIALADGGEVTLDCEPDGSGFSHCCTVSDGRGTEFSACARGATLQLALPSSPSTATIELGTPDGRSVSESVELDYESSFPNGESCPPECRTTTAMVTL